MKSIFKYIIMFFLFVYVIVPIFFYMKFGFFFTTVNHEVEVKYFFLAAEVIIIYCLIAMLLLRFLPTGKKKIEMPYKYPLWLLCFPLLLSFYKFSFGFMGNIPLVVRYFSQFMNPILLFFVISFYYFQKKYIKRLTLCIVIFLSISLLNFSRSGIFTLFFILGSFYFYNQKTGKYLIKKMFPLLLIAIIGAPVLYVVSSNNRYHEKRGMDGYILRQIVGRLSILEPAAGIIKSVKEDKKSNNLFLEKYGFSNQIKLALNTLSPLDFFEDDVASNQYYRMIVNNVSLSETKNNYVSIFISLPVYFYLKYGFVFGLLFFSSLLSILFVIFIYGKNSLFKFSIGVFSFYFLLVFFDWIDVFDLITKWIIFSFFLHIFLDNKKLFIYCRNKK